MNTIKYNETESLKIQVSNLKKNLIKANVILGKNFTLQIATLLIQIEKLVTNYDSKRLESNFNADIQNLKATISNLNHLKLAELIKTNYEKAFGKAETNKQKKHVMFKLLFFHVNLLLIQYQKNNTGLDKSIKENLEPETIFEISKPTTEFAQQPNQNLTLSNELETINPVENSTNQKTKLPYHKIPDPDDYLYNYPDSDDYLYNYPDSDDYLYNYPDSDDYFDN